MIWSSNFFFFFCCQIGPLSIKKDTKWGLKWTSVRIWTIFFHMTDTCLQLEGHIGKITSIYEFAPKHLPKSHLCRLLHSPSALASTNHHHHHHSFTFTLSLLLFSLCFFYGFRHCSRRYPSKGLK